MNSLKSTITILFLLGVSYGVYRLIHTPDPLAMKDGQFFVQLSPLSEPSPPAESKGPNLLGSVTGSIAKIAPQQNPVFQPPPSVTTRSDDPASTQPPWSSEANSNQNLSSSVPADRRALTEASPDANRIPTTSPPTTVLPVGGPGISAPNLVQPPANPPKIMTGPLTPVSSQSVPIPNSTSPLIAPLVPPTKSSANTPNSLPTMPPTSELRTPTSSTTMQDLKSAWPLVDAHVRKGEISQSLKVLSQYYHANLSEAERAELLTWLDTLAFKVIYSTEHHLSPTPHIVSAGETVDSIAKQWNIPTSLLLNINQTKIPADKILTPGLELKIVRGPFRAEIDSQRQEMTLFLDQLYAGRFAIDTSKCASIPTGPLSVKNIVAGANGEFKLELDNGLYLCAANSSASTNSIELSVADAKDLFGILSTNSQVTIVR